MVELNNEGKTWLKYCFRFIIIKCITSGSKSDLCLFAKFSRTEGFDNLDINLLPS